MSILFSFQTKCVLLAIKFQLMKINHLQIEIDDLILRGDSRPQVEQYVAIVE